MRVLAYLPQGVVSLAVGLATSVFRQRAELHDFTLEFCAQRPGAVATDAGLPLSVRAGVRRLATAGAGDVVLVLPGGAPEDTAGSLVDALRHAHARGALVAAHCSGVFALADAGLLDGRAATTHWQYAAALRLRHPQVDVRTQSLYVDEGDVVTGAGGSAGADLYLHLVRRERGAALANTLARVLVLAPHRSGDQAQFVVEPVSAGVGEDDLREVLAWARANLAGSPTVDDLARRAHMSTRTFLRRFASVTGSTPHRWLVHQRLLRAEELLETTRLPLEVVAHRVGFSSSALLRERFVQRRGVSPREYRRTFGESAVGG